MYSCAVYSFYYFNLRLFYLMTPGGSKWRNFSNLSWARFTNPSLFNFLEPILGNCRDLFCNVMPGRTKKNPSLQRVVLHTYRCQNLILKRIRILSNLVRLSLEIRLIFNLLSLSFHVYSSTELCVFLSSSVLWSMNKVIVKRPLQR